MGQSCQVRVPRGRSGERRGWHKEPQHHPARRARASPVCLPLICAALPQPNRDARGGEAVSVESPPASHFSSAAKPALDSRQITSSRTRSSSSTCRSSPSGSFWGEEGRRAQRSSASRRPAELLGARRWFGFARERASSSLRGRRRLFIP